MFENIIHQEVVKDLSVDIVNHKLPQSILFYGPSGSGKLTCALELARILSCTAELKGSWNCNCTSCRSHKSLSSNVVLLCGPGDRGLEIKAAKNNLLYQACNNSRHLEAARYLYIRAVRKLTARFNNVLWEGNSVFSEIISFINDINEQLELILPGVQLPEVTDLQGILDIIEKKSDQLEQKYLYDSLPVNQVRNISSWAHLSAEGEKKIVIIQNADCMADAARNALLKTLEEPPRDTMFILTTKKRGAILPTILSRVRTYQFGQRNPEQVKEVITRIFHYIPPMDQKIPDTVEKFLYCYLPVKPEQVQKLAVKFFISIAEGHIPDISETLKVCQNFEPRILFKIFLQGIIEAQHVLVHSAVGCFASEQILQLIQKCNNNVFIVNQNPAASLEELARNLMLVNKTNSMVFKQVLNQEN